MVYAQGPRQHILGHTVVAIEPTPSTADWIVFTDERPIPIAGLESGVAGARGSPKTWGKTLRAEHSPIIVSTRNNGRVDETLMIYREERSDGYTSMVSTTTTISVVAVEARPPVMSDAWGPSRVTMLVIIIGAADEAEGAEDMLGLQGNVVD